ncbi:MAG: TIM barrel protein [Candidatus Micrarchaeota archaeon]|nr:TIM barrel protein [Candidatus Micrarchaeota archaeon]
MRFGPAGVPISCEKRDSVSGIECAHKLGLDAFELEFVHGCRMKEDVAKEAGAVAKKYDIVLSAHASYYLNLLSENNSKYKKTVNEILLTAKILDAAGGDRLVFHPGFFLKLSHSAAYERMRKEFKYLAKEIEENGYNIHLSPETTGKQTAFGSLEDLYSLSEEIGYDKIRPTVDWAHLHARDNGRFKKKQDYAEVLELIEKKVGKEGLKTLHCHMSSINFSAKGERNHLTMDHDIPPLRPLFEALHEFKCDGVFISESPNIEKDAIYMKKLFNSMK